MVLQSVLLPKSKFTEEEAIAWVKKHKYKTTFKGKKNDHKAKYYRFRQATPPKKFVRYHITNLPLGIKLVEFTDS